MHLGNIADPFMPGAVVLRNEKVQPDRDRPGVNAAVRGCDWRHPIDGDDPPNEATIKQALYLRQIYTEVLAMEERLVPIRQLMLKQSDEGRREVELTKRPGCRRPGREVPATPRPLGGAGSGARRRVPREALGRSAMRLRTWCRASAPLACLPNEWLWPGLNEIVGLDGGRRGLSSLVPNTMANSSIGFGIDIESTLWCLKSSSFPMQWTRKSGGWHKRGACPRAH